MKVEAIKVEDGFLIPFKGNLEKIQKDKIWLEVEIIEPHELN
jgi:transcription antitermination factor NusG